MTTIYPGAKWRPIARNYTPRRRTTTRGVILHTTASRTATSMHGWFNSPGANASAHLHIDVNGKVEQYVDLDHIAWATGSANSSTVAIETQGDGTTAWTAKQRAALVKVLAWLCKHYGIPARVMASSLASERGIGWHRLGVDGNFPALPSHLAGRGQRGKGESWSKYRGKVCPGDARIRQVPGIVADVADALKPKPKPNPKPDVPGWYTVRGVLPGDTLKGRSGPSRKHRIKHQRKNGFELYAVKLVKGDGITWAVTRYGTHYSTAYLKKGRTS